MKITFLNVGQGDSIILDWIKDDINHIGIIDCCKYNGTNPVVEYLESKNNDYSIRFLFLSHPHFDHYSGYNQLLDMIDKNNIRVKYFIHTIEKIDPRYLKWSEIDEEKVSKLESLLDKVKYLIDERKLIGSVQYSVENWRIELSDNYFLKALSPSDKERTEFYAKIDFFEKDDWSLCSSAMNYLCSILYLENTETNTSILLSSDALECSFARLKNEKLKFSFFQIPHHGSIYSHHEPFWLNQVIDSPKKGIISAGINKKYNHPDYKVVEFFDSIGIDLSITNYVNGFKEYFDRIDVETMAIIKSLDDISEPIIESYMGIDKGIEIEL